MSASPYFEDLIADLIDAEVSHVSLHTGAPSGGNEVVGGGYTREAVAFNRTGTDPTVMSNNAIIEFPPASADWGVITHFALWDAPAGGNMIGDGVVTVPRDIRVGDIARWMGGDLVVTVN